MGSQSLVLGLDGAARTFLEEQESDQFELRPAANLPEGYVEAVLLDPEGDATATKRVLFPT